VHSACTSVVSLYIYFFCRKVWILWKGKTVISWPPEMKKAEKVLSLIVWTFHLCCSAHECLQRKFLHSNRSDPVCKKEGSLINHCSMPFLHMNNCKIASWLAFFYSILRFSLSSSYIIIIRGNGHNLSFVISVRAIPFLVLWKIFFCACEVFHWLQIG